MKEQEEETRIPDRDQDPDPDLDPDLKTVWMQKKETFSCHQEESRTRPIMDSKIPSTYHIGSKIQKYPMYSNILLTMYSDTIFDLRNCRVIYFVTFIILSYIHMRITGRVMNPLNICNYIATYVNIFLRNYTVFGNTREILTELEKDETEPNLSSLTKIQTEDIRVNTF